MTKISLRKKLRLWWVYSFLPWTQSKHVLFEINSGYFEAVLLDGMFGLYLRQPWCWRWSWKVLNLKSVGIYGLEIPFLEVLFVDKLGMFKPEKSLLEIER